MLEFPEIKHLASQLQKAIPGKTIDIVSFPGTVKQFVFSEETQPEFRERLLGKSFDQAVQANGRTTKRDLYNQPGGYEVLRATLGTPCPACDTEIIKFPFEGGTCYICPSCQPDPRE